MDPEAAVIDFKQRREFYKQLYEPVDDSDGPSIKIINSRQFIVTNSKCQNRPRKEMSRVEWSGAAHRVLPHLINVVCIVLALNAIHSSWISTSQGSAFRHELAYHDTDLLFHPTRSVRI
jgi:hypothetical protein